MKNRLQFAFMALLLASTASFPEPPTRLSVTPIQAELMADVHTHLAKPGETVFARVTVDWRGSDCVLRKGSILEAHVINVIPHSKTSKASELSLAFTRAQCGELKMGDFALVLAALAAPVQDMDMGIISAPVPLGTGGGAAGIAAVKAMQFNSSFNIELNTPNREPSEIPRLQMGEVAGLHGVKLSVGTGPGESSVLTSANHDVSLERRTALLLVPLQGTFPHQPSVAAASANGTQPLASNASSLTSASVPSAPFAQPAPPPVDDTELCEPPQCSLELPSGNTTELGSASASISIRQLGYAPRPQRVMTAFDHDEAMAYLGPDELLVAFNPHILTVRHSFGRSGHTVRVIRAALVNTLTHHVTRTVDWEIPDFHQYLWTLANGRILVHAGAELLVYGPGLKVQNRIPLDGPLAFVRVTPDGNFIAAGFTRERHSPELHAQLAQNLEAEPEEDVEILVLNHNFEPIGKTTSRSGLIPPTLLNEGQTSLLAQTNMRYRIFMQSWDNHPTTVAHFTSSCTPQISSITPDLLFVLSCDKQNNEPQFSVLRPNGKMALKSISTSNQFGFAAQGSANQNAFVVKSVQSTRPVLDGAPFSAADFTTEDLRVYRTADSKRLLDVSVPSPSSSRDGFALAPDGSQLAVLSRDQLILYSIAQK